MIVVFVVSKPFLQLAKLVCQQSQLELNLQQVDQHNHVDYNDYCDEGNSDDGDCDDDDGDDDVVGKAALAMLVVSSCR